MTCLLLFWTEPKSRNEIRGEVAAEVKIMAAAGVRPGLAVVLVGHNPASEIYVRGKVKACEEVGVYSEKLTPPESVSTTRVAEAVSRTSTGGMRLTAFSCNCLCPVRSIRRRSCSRLIRRRTSTDSIP